MLKTKALRFAAKFRKENDLSGIVFKAVFFSLVFLGADSLFAQSNDFENNVYKTVSRITKVVSIVLVVVGFIMMVGKIIMGSHGAWKFAAMFAIGVILLAFMKSILSMLGFTSDVSQAYDGK